MGYKGVKGIDYTTLYFVVLPRMTYLVRKAAREVGMLSSAEYLRNATADAISRDLGIDRDELMENMPNPKNRGKGFIKSAHNQLPRSPMYEDEVD